MTRNGRRCWGIYRELAHSPGRETDDAEILRAAGRELEAFGFSVAYRTPDELLETPFPEVPPFLFVMCERLEILARLSELEARGVTCVNSSAGVRNTYRDLTLQLFARDRVPFPASSIVSTASKLNYLKDVLPGRPSWVKRGDVHATEEGDVVFGEDLRRVEQALEGFARRGIERAVVQEHVPGDLIKFYGVGNGADTDGDPWFVRFHHKGQTVADHVFDEALLAASARQAAASLGLSVFGGDAIATASGATVIIDLNAWPSFALYRADASKRIAAHLAVRFGKEVGVTRDD